MTVFVGVLLVLYFAAMVVGNLAVYHFGPQAAPFTGFLLVGFGNVVERMLQDIWTDEKQMTRRMIALFLAGSILSAVLVPASFRVSLGSVIGFFLSGLVGAAFYARAPIKDKRRRHDLANIIESVLDTLLFLGISFGLGDWSIWFIVYVQIMVKIAGSSVWTTLLVSNKNTQPAEAGA